MVESDKEWADNTQTGMSIMAIFRINLPAHKATRINLARPCGRAPYFIFGGKCTHVARTQRLATCSDI
jgi:hypothetical protein